MTYSIRGLAWIRTLIFSAFAESSQNETVREDTQWIRLEKLILFHATVPKSGTFRLFATHLGPSSLQFHSQEALQPGQVLSVEILLPILGNLKCLAAVKWTLASSPGITGELELQMKPQDQLLFDEFLARQRKNLR